MAMRMIGKTRRTRRTIQIGSMATAGHRMIKRMADGVVITKKMTDGDGMTKTIGIGMTDPMDPHLTVPRHHSMDLHPTIPPTIATTAITHLTKQQSEESDSDENMIF